MLASTIQETIALPVPLLPVVTLIQLASLLAVHGQSAGAVTATEPVSAAEVWERLVADSSYVHPGADGRGEDAGVGVDGVVGMRSVHASRPTVVSHVNINRARLRGREIMINTVPTSQNAVTRDSMIPPGTGTTTAALDWPRLPRSTRTRPVAATPMPPYIPGLLGVSS